MRVAGVQRNRQYVEELGLRLAALLHLRFKRRHLRRIVVEYADLHRRLRCIPRDNALLLAAQRRPVLHLLR